MNRERAQLILLYAEHNMNLSEVANNCFWHRNTLDHRLDRIYDLTGLDPKNFYDLVKLVDMANEFLKEGETDDQD